MLTTNGHTKKTDYLGNFVYQNDSLQYLQTGYGRAVWQNSTVKEEYFVKDHLGNILSIVDVFPYPMKTYLAVYLTNATAITCETCDNGIDAPGNVFFDHLRVQLQKGRLRQETQYYPFGLPMSGVGGEAIDLMPNRQKYQGNEFITEAGLNWMSFGARQYDPQTARFLGVDPLADQAGQESLSPFQAMGNNPVTITDPGGMIPPVFFQQAGGGIIGSDLGGANDKINVILWNEMFNLDDDLSDGDFLDGGGGDEAQSQMTSSMYYTGGAGFWNSAAYTDIGPVGASGDGDVKGNGGDLDGKNLNDYVGSKSESNMWLTDVKKIDGVYLSHDQVRDFVQKEINNLSGLKDFLANFSNGATVYSVVVANTAASVVKISIGKLSIPVTVALGMAIHGENSHISSDQKILFQGLINYYQSGYSGGLYYIKIHSANMWNPFSEHISHSLYYSNGNYLTGYHHGPFLGF